jgi:adenylate cyclase
MRLRPSHLAAFGLPLIAMLAFGAFAPDAIEGMRNFSFDAYQRIRPRVWTPDTPVRIVDVDEESLAKLGQWPWPRNRLAQIVDIARENGAATVGFDMVFAEPDRLSPDFFTKDLPAGARAAVERALDGVPGNDDTFAQAVARSNVVLGAILTDNGAAPDLPDRGGFVYAGDDPAPFLVTFSAGAAPLPKLARASAGIGALNWLPGRDHVVREAPLLMRLGSTIVPSLALELLRTAQGVSTVVVRSSNASGQTAFGQETGVNTIKVGDFELATGPHAEQRVYFSRFEKGRYLPAWKFLAGEIPRDEIEGRILLVGASAAGVLDQRATPVERVTPGVDVHAQIVEHALGHGDLVRPDWAAPAELFAACVLALIASLAASVAAPLAGALVGLGAIVAMFGVAWQAFSAHGVLIDPLYPSATVAVSYLAGAVELLRHERSLKAQVKNAFGRFVSPAVVERIAASPEKLTLGGEGRIITLMFCDMRDFTHMSEGLTANEIISFMNDYLTPLSDLILVSGGTIDKYIGDAIMAFWNAPLDDPDHARNACRTALAMRVALANFNIGRKELAAEQGRAHRDAHFGVGLNTGFCSVGNLGSIRRFDYSAIGDPVNVASRIENLSKFYRFDVIGSDETQQAAPEFAWLELDRVQVKGRQQPTRLFALAGDPAMAQSPEFVALRERHDAMLGAYRARAFIHASEIAGELSRAYPQHAPLYRRYAVLCEEADATPPEEWRDVRRMLDK